MRLITFIFRLFTRLWRAWRAGSGAHRVRRARRGGRDRPALHLENPERIRIGNYVLIGHGAAFHGVGEIDIGDNISFSPNVHIHTSNHRYEGGEAIPYDRVSYLKPVRVESHAWMAPTC